MHIIERDVSNNINENDIVNAMYLPKQNGEFLKKKKKMFINSSVLAYR